MADGVSRGRLARAALPAALAFALVAVVLLPLCGVAFGCGCSWPFFGGSEHCNMHNPAPPHCPVCTQPWSYGLGFSASLYALSWWGLAALLRRVRASGYSGPGSGRASR